MIDIVDFYKKGPDEKKQALMGSLHIYIPEMEMDIRGISVFKKKCGYHFQLPFRMGWDYETQKKVMYPVIQFTDHRKNKALMAHVKKKGTEFMENLFKKRTPSKT